MKPYLASRYKRYANGGWTDQKQSNMESGIGLASSAVSLIDGFVKANEYGRKPTSMVAVNAAAQGAAMGSKLGPMGAVAGGVLGGAAGLVKGIIDKKKEDNLRVTEGLNRDSMIRMRSAAALAADPTLQYGDQNATGYYANGGPLAKGYMKAAGGYLKPMSSEAVEVKGPSHENGGVQLPAQQAEVEGGETIHNDFVFSDKLGFADDHKKIARAIGKIESKGVLTPERNNAIKRLEERQENLKLSQEYFKQIMLG